MGPAVALGLDGGRRSATDHGTVAVDPAIAFGLDGGMIRNCFLALSLSLSRVPFRTAVSLFLTPFRLRVARVRLVHPDLSALDVDIYLYHGGT